LFPRHKILGTGGMARVWLSNLPDGTQVALKELLATDPTDIARFEREADIIAAIQHPNICRVFQRVSNEDPPFLIIELLAGGTLREWMIEARKHSRVAVVPEPLAVLLLDALLAGLGAAHDLGVVHRDLKPSNVMFSADGVPKLVDFGIAKRSGDATLTATQMLIGTPAYMSPEQASGAALDGRSDLFSMGLMLHELIVGSSPYASNDPMVSLARLLHLPVPPLWEVAPWVSNDLARVHAKLTARDVSQRFTNAAEAREALAPLVALSGGLRAWQDAHAAPVRVRSILEAHARRMLAGADTSMSAKSAWQLYLASQLAPGLPVIEAAFEQVSSTFSFGQPSVELANAVADADAHPAAPGIVKRAVELARAQGNLPIQVRYARRYLVLRPTDGVVRQQLEQVLGAGFIETPTAASLPAPALRTADIVAGIKTGGVVVRSSDATIRQPTGPVLRTPMLVPVPAAPPSFFGQPVVRRAMTLALVVAIAFAVVWMAMVMVRMRKIVGQELDLAADKMEDKATESAIDVLMKECRNGSPDSIDMACSTVINTKPPRRAEREALCRRAQARSRYGLSGADADAKQCIELGTGGDELETAARAILNRGSQ
jgi:hypothetical protein